MNTAERIERACALMPLTVHQLAQCLGTSKRYIRSCLQKANVCHVGSVKSNGRPWNLYSTKGPMS